MTGIIRYVKTGLNPSIDSKGFLISHSAVIMNGVVGRLPLKVTTLFELTFLTWLQKSAK